MPILELKEFSKLREQGKPILCLDLGQKRIGLALSDRGWKLASPNGLIENKKFTNTAGEVLKLFDENECAGLVIGLPKNTDDTEGPKCQSARQFGRNLIKIREGLNIYFQDERYTTIEAERVLSHSNLSRDKKNKKVDQIAASFILQAFLDQISETNG